MNLKKSIVIIASILLYAFPALANNPPAPQTMVANLIMVPLTMIFFLVTGAAAAWDYEHNIIGWKRRIVIWLILFGLTCLSGVHEGFGFLISIVLAFYSFSFVYKMLAVAFKISMTWNYTRVASLVGGLILIPTILLLAGFSYAFMFPVYDEFGYRHVQERLQKFSQYQRNYTSTHGGIYAEIPAVAEIPDLSKSGNSKDIEIKNKELQDSGMRLLIKSSNPFRDRKYYDVSVIYGAALKSYSLEVVPLMFRPWPYGHLTKVYAYYLDQTGAIHAERVKKSGVHATVSSPVIWTLDTESQAPPH
jgi:hypothetical protein